MTGGDILISFKVELAEVRAAYKAAQEALPKEIHLADVEVAQAIVRTMQELAPRGRHEGSGAIVPIWESIKVQESAAQTFFVFGGDESPHAIPINFGPSTIPRYHSTKRTHIKGKEFYYTAIAMNEPRITEAYERAVTKVVRFL